MAGGEVLAERSAGRAIARPITLFGPLPPPTGGVATHVRQLADGLASRGLQARVLAYGEGPMPPGVMSIRFRPRLAFVTRFLTAVPHSGILHGHSWLTSHPDFTALHGYVGLLRARGCRWVETLHSGSLPDRFAGWSSRERRTYARSLARAERLIAVSEPLREFLIDIGLSRERIVVIGPLLPAALELEPGEPDATTARFIETHHPTILAVGAMLPTYDYVPFGEVFARLRRAYPDAGLILVSTGSAVDGTYRSTVRGALESSRAHVLERQDVPRDELLGVMARASVMLRAFRSESYGLSRVEALLLGTPVVATAVGEQHGVIPYAVGDADSLEAALRSALASPRPDAAALHDHFARKASDNLDSIVEVYASCG